MTQGWSFFVLLTSIALAGRMLWQAVKHSLEG